MRIYLDNCAFNRPYDDLSRLSVNLEAQAKLQIQYWIRDGRFALVSSEMLMKEIGDCPFEIRRKGIRAFVEENSSLHIGAGNNPRIDLMAREIMKSGVKYKDACHVASAILGDCAYLITTDKRLLNYRSEKLKLVDPIQFVSEMEEVGPHV